MRLLAHSADWKTVAYMASASLIAVLHWCVTAFNPVMFGFAVLLAFCISAMHHNHSHQPIWRGRGLNALTDYWFTLFQGHPGYVFEPMHVSNHHRFHNAEGDVTRTDRYRSGNDLIGLLRHPVEFAIAAAGHLLPALRAMWCADKRRFLCILSHYLLLLALWSVALWVDPVKALYVVLLPQAVAMFFLMASNYFQHAGADAASEFGHARNFLGWINPLCFNVGLHTAHHHRMDMHWSELPQIHAQIAERIPTQLIERSFARYCVKQFLLPDFLFSSVKSASVDSKAHGSIAN